MPLLWRVIGNQVKYLNDPVTVSSEPDALSIVFRSTEYEKAQEGI